MLRQRQTGSALTPLATTLRPQHKKRQLLPEAAKISVEDAPLHYHSDPFEVGEVGERIAVNKNQIGALAYDNRAELAVLSCESCGVQRCNAQELLCREPRLAE